MPSGCSEIVALLRGQAACPVLAGLAELGWLEKMLGGPFSAATFSEAQQLPTQAILNYLVAVGLLTEQPANNGQYMVTPLGRSVFMRRGSFCILNSYNDFFQRLQSLLFADDPSIKPAVNRLRNVIGSGQLHSRKFFLPAFEMLGGHSYSFIIDVGCGNGQFLYEASQLHLTHKIAGIDISKIALKESAARIDALSTVQLHQVEADAQDIELWSNQLRWREAGLFSLWFVLHEFSQSDPKVVVEFLRGINRKYPLAQLLIGELVRLPGNLLAQNKAESIMPEFLLFHELSGQGVLTWSQWEEVRKWVPFKVIGEHYLDRISDNDSHTIPSSFIWHLQPI